MTISYSNFFASTVLGTSAAVLLTIPASPAATLLRGGRIRLTNTSGSATTVTLHSVPSAGTPVVGNAFVFEKSINVGDYLDVDVPIMPASATLQALAGAATSITASMLSGGLYS